MPILHVLFSLKSILRSHLNHSNRIRNEQVMAKIRKLIEIGNRAAVVSVQTTLNCTGTTWPKMTSNEIVPLQTQIVPGQVSEKCPESVISPLFHALFHPKPNLYFIYTSKSFQIHLISSIILNHLSIHIFLQDLS